MNSQWHKSVIFNETPAKLQNPGELTNLEHNFWGDDLKIKITYIGIRISVFLDTGRFLINPLYNTKHV